MVGSLREVDLHKVPVWANGAGRGICDKKKQLVDARMAECN